ncbi:MAG TPA: DinB family protein [Candidatus Acidoferrum sp.]
MDVRLERLRRLLESAIAGMSPEVLLWHPPGKWCAAEVLEHLYLTYTGTTKGFERIMSAGRPLASSASIAHRLKALLVIGVGFLPRGRKAPAIAFPRGMPAEQVCAEFAARMVAMDAVIGECEARFGSRLKVLDHPILGPLTAQQWRKFHAVHGMHHHKQLLQLRSAYTASNR